MKAQNVIESPAEKLIVTEERMNRAAKVGPKTSILDIRLIDHTAKTREVSDKSPSLMRNSHGFRVARDEESKVLQVFVSFKTDVAHDNDESRKDPPVTVAATYAVTYKVEELAALSEEDVQAFGEINGKFNAWPFWRELFHSAMGRMGFEPGTMPTLRVNAPKATEAVKQLPE